MNEIITTLHPENDADTNLYPNIKKENIPNKSIDINKLGDDVINLLNNIDELHPSGVDTSAHILAFTSNKGIWVGSDTGKWYYWNGTAYTVGGDYITNITNIEDYKGILSNNSDLDGILISSRYMLLRSYTYSHLPITISSVNNYAMLITYFNTGTNLIQLFIDSDGLITYYRVYKNGSWGSWSFVNSIYHNVNASGMNIDTITKYGNYTVQSTTTGTLPESITQYAILHVDWASTTSQMQTLSIYNGNVYRRFIQNGVCTEWVKIYDSKYPKNYHLPYILDNKVRCNKASNTITAYYTGVNCGDGVKVNVISCKYIWEKTTTTKVNSGVVALIINPNSADKISDITDLSLHLTITKTNLKVDILGNRYGEYYYQNIINQTLTNPQISDGSTQYELTMAISGNTVNVYINGTDSYSGTFTPDSNISSLNDVLGQYALFEHFSNVDMDTCVMPMFTYFHVRQNSTIYVLDKFDRDDGQLTTCPQGLVYHLFSTTDNIG